MTEIRKFSYHDKALMEISDAIRREVFIEEQKVDPEIEYEFEEQGHYYLLFYDDKPIATCRWRLTSYGVKLERFALLKPYRNQGLGSILLKEIVNDVLLLQNPVYLHAQITAVNYYWRAGFLPTGKHFFEANIEHVRMEYPGIKDISQTK